MSYYRRRYTKSYSPVMKEGKVPLFLKIKATVVDATLVTQEIDLPNNNLEPIRTELYKVEIDMPDIGHAADGDYVIFGLSKTLPTAELYLNDTNLIWKWKMWYDQATAVGFSKMQLIIKEFLEKQTIVGQKLYFWMIVSIGATTPVIYGRIFYRMVNLDERELVHNLTAT